MTTAPTGLTPDDEGDAEALSWEGEPVVLEQPRPGPGTYGPVAPAADAPAADVDDEDPVEVAQVPAALLVTFGVFAGIYLLFTIAWATLAVKNWAVSADALIVTVYRIQLVGMALAPALWYATTFAVTRSRPALSRVLGLLVGMLLTIPWPAVLLTGVTG